MYTKNRRSISSSGNQSNHTSSLVSLEGNDTPKKQHRKYQYSQIQKKYLIPLYHSMQEFQNRKQSPQIDMLTNWIANIKKSIHRLRQYSKQIQLKASQTANQISEMELKKQSQVINMKMSMDEELRFMQSQLNKKIIDLNAQYGKKQQQYKQIISKFIESMQNAQKTWTKNYTIMMNKFKKIDEIIRNSCQVDARNKEVYAKIVQFIDTLYEDQHDSFCSENLSFEEQPKIVSQFQNKPNTIQFSSIQNNQNELQDQRTQQKFQVCLMRLISWNFFCSNNQNNIRKLIQIIKLIDNQDNLFQEPIFPILIEAFKSNLKTNKQQGTQENQQSQIQNRFPLKEKQKDNFREQSIFSNYISKQNSMSCREYPTQKGKIKRTLV